MGDSGGDGPHFKWAANQKAIRVASMAKPSLKLFCTREQVEIDHFFGISYQEGQSRHHAEEMQVDFRELIPFIEDRMGDHR